MTVKMLKHTLNNLCYMTKDEELRRDIDHLPVVIRSGNVIDEHLYIDIENGRVIITPKSYYT